MLSEAEQVKVYTAHGTLGCLAWAIVMPIGAIMIRFVPSTRAWIVHGGIMLLGLAMFTANFGIGVNMALTMFTSLSQAEIKDGIHYFTGIVLFSLAWLQPFTGYAHHFFYKVAGQRSVLSAIHVFFGRLLMLIGIINGGYGLLAGGYSSRAENIAYGTVAGAVWVTYIFTSLWFEIERQGGTPMPSVRPTPSASQRDLSRSSSGGQPAMSASDVEHKAAMN